jgi:hypothetical protein
MDEIKRDVHYHYVGDAVLSRLLQVLPPLPKPIILFRSHFPLKTVDIMDSKINSIKVNRL